VGYLLALLLLQDAAPEPVKGLTVGIRFTDLGGTLDGDSDWADLFDAGIGLEVGYEYLHPVSRKVHIGGYFRTAFDHFGGDEVDLSDSFGPLTLTADDMTLLRVTIGGRVRETFKSFFMDQSIGIGFVTISDVDAEINDAGTTFDASVIDGGTEFTFELQARFGFVISPAASIWISFGYENNGAPDVASDVDDGSFDYENQKNFVFTIGASFDF
jgi:hypothetical protein